jgi:hypothetical protein
VNDFRHGPEVVLEVPHHPVRGFQRRSLGMSITIWNSFLLSKGSILRGHVAKQGKPGEKRRRATRDGNEKDAFHP